MNNQILFRVQRFLFEEDTTISMWKINNVFHCWCLEDKVRTVKIVGKTAISSGVYEIDLEISPKYGLVPTLKNVPQFEFIRVHGGNEANDTRGCLLVGYELKSPERIENCKPALDKIIAILKSAGGKGLISIEDYVPPVPEVIV